MLIGLDRVEYGLCLAQFTALGQAASVENQRPGVGIVFTQQRGEDGFGVSEAALVEQCLGLFERVGRGRRRHLHMRLEQRAHGRLRLRTGKTVDGLAILEQHHGRQAANTEAGHDVLFDIAIDLGQQQLALIALGDGLQHWHQHFAGRTPFGPEIHQHRLVEGVLDHGLLEVGGRGVEDVGRFLTHGGSLGKLDWVHYTAWRGVAGSAPVGADLSAMVTNDDAGYLMPSGGAESIADKSAPTGGF
ncbi:hypothetical protein D3C73_1136750 [compost metagenome]